MEPINVLLIEDNPDDVLLLKGSLQRARATQFSVADVPSLKTGLERINNHRVDIVLLDLSLLDSSGLDTLKSLQSKAPDVPIIVLSGLDDETLAVKAVHAGAQDYLVKGRIDPQLLSRAMLYAIERTQARAELLHAEEKYRKIYENAVEGIFQTTPDGRYLSANPALTRIYGYDSPEELISQITDIGSKLYVDPKRRAEFIRIMQEHQVVTDFESKIYKQDGAMIWISENVRAVRDRKGNLAYYEGTVEDITKRRRAEEKLRNSEALYHSLVETLPQNIFRKDLNERFTFANKRFCETLGKPLTEILGKTDFDFFPADLAAKYQADDRKILQAGQSFETVEEHQPPGGEKIYVQVVKTPLYDSEGEIIGLQGIFWDMTERRRAEEGIKRANEQLAHSREELRKKNEMMEDDLRMAHEIQQAILPQQYPTFPANVPPSESKIHFCHRYHPTGAVGGDFFNVLPLSETKAGIFICDVMGHGVRSALVTAMVRALVEELRSVGGDPGQLLTRLNRDLSAILHQTGTPLFTTAFYLVADLENREYCFSNAGHPKPFLLKRQQKRLELLPNSDGKPRPALGLFQDTIYPTNRTPMHPNDMLLLFTDGIYELEGDDNVQYSPELFINAVTNRMHLSAPQLCDEVLKEIQNFSVTSRFTDDVCLVAVEISPNLD